MSLFMNGRSRIGTILSDFFPQEISRDGKALRVSPLMLAVMNGDEEIVRMLVDHRGVFLLATNDCGDTALRYVFHSVPYSIM